MQAAGGDRLSAGVELVFTQEHLVRGMRGIGLVLVDERRRLVVVEVHVVGGAEDAVGAGGHAAVGGARQRHEALGGRQIVTVAEDPVGAGDERVIRLQRNEDGSVAALIDQVEAVIEELAEEREPGVELRRQRRVRRRVRDEEHLPIVVRAENAVQTRAHDGSASPLATAAARFAAVWSEIRLEMMRGSASTTLVVVA